MENIKNESPEKGKEKQALVELDEYTSETLKKYVKDGRFTVKFPEKIEGDFNCFYLGLETLNGCPSIVGGSFDCLYNYLTSLSGCPEAVSGDFSCSFNKLTSLSGCPEAVSGDFSCSFNKLTSLLDCPKETV